MDARELMIGDWARIRYNHFETGKEIVKDFRVGQLAKLGLEDDDPLYAWSEKSNMALVSKVEPIPLTPEILEKNGFVQNPRSKSRRSHQICTDSVYISWWRGRLNILFKPFIGHSTNHVNVDGKYVFCVRGWGHLTGTGGLHLPCDDAERIQDGFIEYIQRCLTYKGLSL